MKLIEKLARDWALDDSREDPYPPRDEVWMAGFRAAREMAHKRFDLAFERNEVVQDTLDAIETLGESEVQE